MCYLFNRDLYNGYSIQTYFKNVQLLIRCSFIKILEVFQHWKVCRMEGIAVLCFINLKRKAGEGTTVYSCYFVSDNRH